jgi:hypothetical protein
VWLLKDFQFETIVIREIKFFVVGVKNLHLEIFYRDAFVMLEVKSFSNECF